MTVPIQDPVVQTFRWFIYTLYVFFELLYINLCYTFCVSFLLWNCFKSFISGLIIAIAKYKVSFISLWMAVRLSVIVKPNSFSFVWVVVSFPYLYISQYNNYVKFLINKCFWHFCTIRSLVINCYFNIHHLYLNSNYLPDKLYKLLKDLNVSEK